MNIFSRLKVWQQGKDQTFQSVILAGVYDIKTLKLKLHPQDESKITVHGI